MLLTIGTTHSPATDLGFLLHKNPARAQSVELTFGKAHVFYPEASAERCTAALIVDIDPVGLVRGRERDGPAGDGGVLAQYVNDRPYVASSFLSVAIAETFGTAMSGRSKERPDLATTAIPLEASLVVPCREGLGLLRRLFEPLDYTVVAEPHVLDETIPSWGDSRYFSLTLTATRRVSELLAHLYVLIPVLDNEKHYWVGDDEVGKLLRHGEGWLATHPERELITRRYLKHQRSLVNDAIAQILAADDSDSDAAMAIADVSDVAESAEVSALPERASNLNELRLLKVAEELRACGASSVLDLGCGEGRLLRLLLAERQFTRIVGMDVSYRVLEVAAERLKLDWLSPLQRARILLLHGSLLYRDERIAGFDAAAVVEVIEHLDAPRLAAFERVAFEFAKPRTVVLTTPNADYNVRWPSLPAGKFRHLDHRFEWTRAQFVAWANSVAARFGYGVRFETVGPVDTEVGSPTQMAVFTRVDIDV